MKIYPLVLATALAALLLSGCASIVDGRPKVVTITSDPPGAKVTVADNRGHTISENTTPASISLKRGDGYFVPAKYKLMFEAPGYYPSEVTLKATLNGWYFGNIVAGGAVGLFLVDPATGAMWTFSPSDIHRNLIPSTTSLSAEDLKAAEGKANPPKVYAPSKTGKK
jgi:hypothetical protein